MKKLVISAIMLFTFVGIAESAPKAKTNMKKQEVRIRCKPGFMFERGKCIIIPNMENTSMRH